MIVVEVRRGAQLSGACSVGGRSVRVHSLCALENAAASCSVDNKTRRGHEHVADDGRTC
jgi:hypothetical protein